MSMLDRKANLARQHVIPVGSLVELDDGVRLWVVEHARDCDGTPQYTLAISPYEPLFTDISRQYYSQRVEPGYLEESLIVIRRAKL